MRSIPWLTLAVLALPSFAAPLRADGPDSLDDRVRAYINARMSEQLAAAHLPSFSRQTGLACSACHYQFLQLTPLGREFKLNGYTLTREAYITEKDKSKGETLKLLPIPLVAAMIQASYTHLNDALPGKQNDNTELPQALSVFLAGGISSKIGIFSQFTYTGADATFAIDNIDLRFANKTKLGGSTDMIYGVSLNNSPTVQDVWNTGPVWGFPFATSDIAPTGAASTVIDLTLAQQALGIGAYTLLAKTVYAEFSVYRSAIQGRAAADSFAIEGVAPYWRLALQRDWERQSFMVGTFGMHTNKFPGAVGVGIPTDHFTDVALDGQFETKVGVGALVARGVWIHEKQTLDATFAAGGSANLENVLKVFRFNTSYYPTQRLGLTAGYFQTTGTVDPGLYAPAPVTGSANGNPKTNGFIGEIDVNPWQNARIGLQYTAFANFNGSKTGYDGSGRSASGNNTVYLLAWLVF
jgi:hypothetical protein